MSSLKMTFSLTSLIFLIALGLVFVPVSVMAHTTGNLPTSHPSHTHPVTVAVPDNTNTTGVDETVPIHNAHPVPTITLKAQADVVKGDEIKLAAAPANAFTLVVTFDQAVNAGASDGTATTIGASDLLTTGHLTFRTVNGAGITVASGFGSGNDQVALGTVVRTGEAGTTFELPITIGADSIPDGMDGTTADANLNKLEFRIQVNVNAAYGLQKDVGVTTVPGGSSAASVLTTFMLVKDFTPDVIADPDPVMFKVEGMPTFDSAGFVVTFTSTTMSAGKLMGTELLDTDLKLENVSVSGLNSNSSPPDAPMTVWKALATAWPGVDKISITIKEDSKRAPAADATMGMLTLSAPEATLLSITVPAGTSDAAAFVATLTFDKALAAGVSVTAADLMVTPTTAVVGNINIDTLDSKKWHVGITPTAGTDTKIALSKAGMDRFTYTGDPLTVMKSPSVITGTIANATYDGSAATAITAVTTTTITSGVIAANGFAVIEANHLPDLQVFFNRGGSITVNNGDAVDDGVDDKGNRTKGSRTVVISEILWGYDVGLRAVQPQHKGYQFIELYNTTALPIDLAGWKLIFTPGRSVPNIDIDQVSNRQGGGWNLDPSSAGEDGQNGYIYNTTAVNPLNRIDGVRIISMYRNIHYYNIEVTHIAKREELLKQIPDGNVKASWKASVSWTTNPWVYDSKGIRHRGQQVYQPGLGVVDATSVPRSPFVINEIGKSSDGSNDWIELRNTTDSNQSLKNYVLSVVKGHNSEDLLFHFHDKNYVVPPKRVVVITSTHPKDNDLASGIDLAVEPFGDDNTPEDKQENQVLKGLNHLYIVKSFSIPASDKTLLILRKGYNNKTGDFFPGKQLPNIIDVVGTLGVTDNARGTSLWPLNGISGGPHAKAIGGDAHFMAGKVYQRDSAKNTGENAMTVIGYTGVGYDRHAAAINANGGTPGYDNGAVKGDKSNWMDQVTISEIMLPIEETETTTGERIPRATRLPQWFEIYNSSMTEAVSLHNWYLEIQNTGEEFEGFAFRANLHGQVRLPNVIVQPNQTVLVVSDSGLNSGDFPEQRTINLFTNSGYRREFGLVRRGDPVLNPKGFYIQLRDHKNNHVDEVGNLGLSHGMRTGIGRRFTNVDNWDITSLDVLSSSEGHRTSIIRIYDSGIPRSGLLPIANGVLPDVGWRLASEVEFRYIPSLTYFGNHRDFGTPGYRGGGPLPVSLSKFRPERMKDTGEIVVRWVTESELNNAGFNILRREKGDTGFTKVHYQAGQGTTSERTVYEWKDKTAKPNVVYYYQIQDVSLDGKVTPLRITHLRGNVTAAGKATTTWGEIKALQ